MNKILYKKQIDPITQAIQSQIKIIEKKFTDLGDDKFIRITKRL